MSTFDFDHHLLNRNQPGVALLARLALLLFLSLAACEQRQTIGIRFQFGGCPGSDVRSLVVNVTDANQNQESTIFDPVPLDPTLGLSISRRLQGNSLIQLEARDAEQCVVARGSTTVNLSERRDPNDSSQDLVVLLQCLPSKECPGGPDPRLNPTIIPTHSWSLRCGSSAADLGSGVAFDHAGNVFITGSFGGSNLECNVQGLNDPSARLKRFAQSSFLAKFSPTGELLWEKHLGGPYANAPAVLFPRVTVDEAGNAFVWAQAIMNQNIKIEGADTNPINKEYFVAKYSPLGEFRWLRESSAVIWTVTAQTFNGKPSVVLGGACSNGTEVMPGQNCPASGEYATLLFYEDDPAFGPRSPNLRTFAGKGCDIQRIWLHGEGVSWTTICPGGQFLSSPGNTFLVRLKPDLSHDDNISPVPMPGEATSEGYDGLSAPFGQTYGLSVAVDSSANSFVSFTKGLSPGELLKYSKFTKAPIAESQLAVSDSAIASFVDFDHDENPIVGGPIFLRNGKHNIFVTKLRNALELNSSPLWSAPIIFVTTDTSPIQQNPTVALASHRESNRIALVSRINLETFDASPNKDPGTKLHPRVHSGNNRYELVVVIMEPH